MRHTCCLLGAGTVGRLASSGVMLPTAARSERNFIHCSTSLLCCLTSELHTNDTVEMLLVYTWGRVQPHTKKLTIQCLMCRAQFLMLQASRPHAPCYQTQRTDMPRVHGTTAGTIQSPAQLSCNCKEVRLVLGFKELPGEVSSNHTASRTL